MTNLRATFTGLFVSLLLLGTPTNSFAQQRRTGTNLPELSAYASMHAFGDAMKQSTGWLLQYDDFSGWDVDTVNGVPMQPMPVDANGYPLEVPFDFNGESFHPHCVLLSAQSAPWYYPTGNYTLVLEGTGEVQLEWDVATTTFTAPGTYTVNVQSPSDAGLHLTVLSSDVNDPINNINFYFPGHQPGQHPHPFHERFLETIRPWEVLRFIKATQTEENPIVDWADRTTIDTYTYNIDDPGNLLHGMPWELVIELCNLEQVDPWINIPYQANDAYVDSLITLFYNNLDPNLTVHFEYSNETWNWNYYNTHNYVNLQGLQAGLSTDTFTAGLMYSTVRQIEITEAFQQIYGNEYDDRVRSVMSTQGWNYPIDVVYQTFNSSQHNPNGTMPHAIACAPYFSGELLYNIDTSLYCSLTQPQIFDSLYAGIDFIMQESLVPFRYYADLMNVDFYTYESGYHVAVPNFGQLSDTCLINLFNDVNRDNEMQNVYCTYMDSMFDNYSLDLDMSFVLAKSYGSEHFGILESQYQDFSTSPKWRAFEQCADLPTAIEDNVEAASNIEVYPNPFEQVINIQGEVNLNVRMFDLTGREVMPSTTVTGPLTVPNLPVGVYILEISNDEGLYETQKVIKR